MKEINPELEKRFCAIFEERVPSMGKADTVGGELVRALMRLVYRFYNDGDRIGEGYGNETCNPPARYIRESYFDKISYSNIEKYFSGLSKLVEYPWLPEFIQYDELLEMAVKDVVAVFDSNDPIFKLDAKNDEDMFDYSRNEDYHYDEEDDWYEDDTEYDDDENEFNY